MFKSVVGKIKSWRLGAVTGAGLTENNMKMMGALLAPFLVMWTAIRIFLPDEMYDLGITFGMIVWLGWIFALWSWAKTDAGNYLVFPQSKWKFQNGACRTFDLKIPADSWEKLVEFKDGSVGCKVFFSEKYLYDDIDLPFPRIFSGAYWLLPRAWDTSFQRRAFGEFFHKGVYVTKPDCEDISVYVIGWETIEGETYPVCIINDCAWTYEQTLKTATLRELGQNVKMGALEMLYRDARKRGHKLTQHTAYLEDRLEVSENESSTDFKHSADERMKAVRKRHARIMDVHEPLLTRILNLKNVATVLLVIVAMYAFGHFILHLW